MSRSVWQLYMSCGPDREKLVCSEDSCYVSAMKMELSSTEGSGFESGYQLCMWLIGVKAKKNQIINSM